LFAWILLSDPIQPMQIAGAALTLAGLMISQRRRRDEQPVPLEPAAAGGGGPIDVAAEEYAAPEGLAAPETEAAR
jgi:hypothetical protein